MAFADFSWQILFQPRLRMLYRIRHVHEISPGKNTIFPSTYLPHLLQLIPSSYWTSTPLAALSLVAA